MISKSFTRDVLFVVASAALAVTETTFTHPVAPAPVDQLLCNTSVGNANGSGLYSFGVEYPTKDNSLMPDPSWAITVMLTDGAKTRTALWYDTAGQPYDHDVYINYDVCAFVIDNIPLNAHMLGQHDPGDCSSVLTPTCASALNGKAAASAHQWVSYTGPNMTDGVLPKICDKIKRDLHDEMLRECQQEFALSETYPNQGLDDIFAIDLTGKNFSNLNNTPCDLTASGDKHFRRVTAKITNSSYEAYWNATQSVYPILTVHMPVANADRKGEFYSRANSSLQCVRAKQIKPGSVTVPDSAKLPLGEAWIVEHDDGGLSSAAKGGVGAGIAVVVVLVIGLVAWLFLRRRRRQRPNQLSSPSFDAGAEHEVKTLMDNDAPIYGGDAAPCKQRHQNESSTMAELGGEGRPAELAHAESAVTSRNRDAT